MLDELCSRCRICSEFLTKTENLEPVLHYSHYATHKEPVEEPRILVIDDADSSSARLKGVALVDELFDGKQDYHYTTTIRCSHDSKKEMRETLETATSRCAVWTHAIEEGRSVILTTKRGLSQLRIDKDCKEGDLFKSHKLGVILVIPNLSTIQAGSSLFNTYKAKVQRVLKEAGL